MIRRSGLDHNGLMDENNVRSLDIHLYVSWLKNYKITASDKPLINYPSRHAYSMGNLIHAEFFLSKVNVTKGWQLSSATARRFPFMPLRRYLPVMRHLADTFL